MLGDVRGGQNLLTDRAYDSDGLRETITCAGHLGQHQVERFFNKLKHYRAIATRYEKHAVNFLALVMLASIRIWLRHDGSVL
jgi:hypothetical protein